MRSTLLLVLLAACRGPSPHARAIPVEVHGALREIMHGGDAAGRVVLADAVGPSVIAIGALADLRGEVTVLDGRVRASRVVDGTIVTTSSAEGSAALLVSARVPRWRSIRIDRALADDAAIGAELRAAGWPPDATVPFVLDGELTTLDWHVVDGPHAHGATSGIAKHTPGRAVVVGFYATTGAGVFTHMGERVHAHVLVGDATGHVDRMVVAPGAVLKVPDLDADRGR